MSYADWEQDALRRVEAQPFIAFGLHDCYARYWLPHYRQFLDRLCARGELWTLDQFAAQMFLAHAR
jgi:hypothetical protein